MNDADFEHFWSAFPRKEGRKDALKAWNQMSPDHQFIAAQSIATHVRFWELSGRERRYIPLAASWIRGERFFDELEMPVSKTDSDWHRSTEGITRKAKEVGITPRPGEDWHSLKARILGKIAA